MPVAPSDEVLIAPESSSTSTKRSPIQATGGERSSRGTFVQVSSRLWVTGDGDAAAVGDGDAAAVGEVEASGVGVNAGVGRPVGAVLGPTTAAGLGLELASAVGLGPATAGWPRRLT